MGVGLSSVRRGVSLRVKIISLVCGTYTLCLMSVLVVGVASFIDNKESYLIDNNSYVVKAASRSVEDQLNKVILMTRVMHSFVQAGDNKSIKKLFEENKRTLQLKKLLILSVLKNGTMRSFSSIGDEDNSLVHGLDQLGWDSQRFINDQILVNKSASGEIALGVFNGTAEEGGGGTAYYCLVTPDLNLLENSFEGSIYLVDALGDPLFQSKNAETEIHRSRIVEILKPILDEKNLFGIKRWSSGRFDYLVSFQRLSFRELTMIGLIPEKIAFKAAQSWFLRAITLGFSILAITLGVILVMMRRITEGLRAINEIIEKVKAGEFSFRLKSRGIQNDEIGVLTTSFNLLAGRIDELMEEAANKVEIKLNNESTRMVRDYLLPSSPLVLKEFCFSGQSLFAPICGGDLWFYEVVRGFVVVFIGKVDGGGISASIIMGSVRGAFSSFCSALRTMELESLSLKSMITQLNSVIYGITQGTQKLSCFSAVFELKTGRLEMINAGHLIPYLLRDEQGKGLDDDGKVNRFRPLPLKKSAALGATRNYRAESDSYQLYPGDMIFWYSPGLLKNINFQGDSLSSDKIFPFLSDLYDQYEGKAEVVAREGIEKIRLFLGESSKNLTDDITIVVGTIPKTARFSKLDESETVA